jgi:hypothetical protein
VSCGQFRHAHLQAHPSRRSDAAQICYSDCAAWQPQNKCSTSGIVRRIRFVVGCAEFTMTKSSHYADIPG